MGTKAEYQAFQDRMAALFETLADRLGPELIEKPQLADALVRHIDDIVAKAVTEQGNIIGPPDGGLSQLVGVGPDAGQVLGETWLPAQIEPYDDTVTSERMIAIGDLYYIYQHEKIGVFQTVLKLQDLFRAGTVRLSEGDGAYRLYQYDRKQALRYTQRDRMQAYRRAFGYSRVQPSSGAKPNPDFHNLMTHFITQVAQFYRDKRVSEVIRPRATDPSFGSIAVVRRAGLDLRGNMKSASYGHISVLRVEVMQLLNEAFHILSSPDVLKLYGADHAWDVVEEVMKLHFNQPFINASQRSRMAIAGRNLIHWLAQPHILNSTRSEFETMLLQIADDAEEWLTSAEALGVARRSQLNSGNGRSSLPRVREGDWEVVYA
jgi:hypothetical protein